MPDDFDPNQFSLKPPVEKYQQYAMQVAQTKGIPQDLFLGMLDQESSWNPTAKNPKSSARGLGQHLDGTLKNMGYQPTGGADDPRNDPYQSIDLAAQHLLEKYQGTKNWQRAVNAYGENTPAYIKAVTAKAKKYAGAQPEFDPSQFSVEPPTKFDPTQYSVTRFGSMPPEKQETPPKVDIYQDPFLAMPEARLAAEPFPAQEIVTGAKQGLINLAERSRAVDPAFAAAAMGYPPEKGPEVPQETQERLRQSTARLSQELFPEGVKPPKDFEASVVRGVASGWGDLLALGSLGPLGSPAAFAAWGLTEEKPVAGAVKGAALGGVLKGMGAAAQAIPDATMQWLARIAGGAGIGAGAAKIEGGSWEDAARQAAIFAGFEAMGGIPNPEKLGVTPKEAEIVKQAVETKQVTPEAVEIIRRLNVPVRTSIEAKEPEGTKAVKPWEMSREEYVKSKSLLPAIKDIDTGEILIGNRGETHADIYSKLPDSANRRFDSGWSTNGEWVSYGESKKIQGTKDAKTTWDKLNKEHEALVITAFAQGKPVPPEVLADYPDLAPKTPPTKPLLPERSPAVEAVTQPPKPLPKIRGYDLDKAIEKGDLGTIIKAYGGFNPQARIIKEDFEPEERRLILLYSRKGAQGPDELLDELKGNYPGWFDQYENDVDLLRAIANKSLPKINDLDKVIKDYHDEIEEQAIREGLNRETLARVIAEDQTFELAKGGSRAGEPPAGKPTEDFWDFVSPSSATARQLQKIYPDISQGQAELLAQDQTLREQFTRGNWEAVARERNLGRVSDFGAERKLPGTGGGLFEEPFREKYGTAKGEKPEGLITEKPQLRHGGGPGFEQVRSFFGKVSRSPHFQSAQALLAPETIKTEVKPGEYAPLAERTHQIIREESGKTMREQMQFEREVDQFRKDVAPLAKDPQARMLFYDAVEQGRSPETEGLGGFANTWRQWSDRVWRDLDKVTNGRVGYLENYWPHHWKDPEKAKLYLAGINPVTGAPLPYIPNRRFMKERKFDLYSDAVKWGLEEKFTNPLDAVKANIWEKNRFLTFQKVANQLREDGLAKYYLEGKEPPGWVKVDTPALRNKIKIGGEEVYQHLYMPADAARVMNNHLGAGGKGSLWANPWYSSYRSISDAIRGTQVALSAFHGSLVTLLDMSLKAGSDMRLGLARALSGDIKGMARAAARLPRDISPLDMIDYIRQGGKVRKAYLQPGTATPEMRAVAERFAAAGGRVNRDAIRGFADSFADVLAEERGLGKISRGYQTGVRYLTHWIMGEVVPRAQMSSFARLSANETEMFTLKNGRGPSAQEQVAIDQNVMQHIHNLMGQLPSDNLALPKRFTQLLYPLVNFPGWNIGSVRWLSGLVRGAGKALTKTEIDPQARHALEGLAGMAAVYGLYGGITHYLLTGEAPQSFKNLRYPGKDGEEVQLPGYLRDLWGWRYHPILTAKSKLSTPLRAAADLLDNRDYMGNKIYDELASGGEQFKQGLTYFGKSVQPFGFQSYERAISPGVKAASLAGATLAPRWALNTPAQTAMQAARKITYARTPAEQEKAQAKMRLMQEHDLGYTDKFEQDLQAAQDKGQLTQAETRRLLKQTQIPKLERQFKGVTSIDDAVRIYDLGTKQEKAAWGPILSKKIWNLRKRDPEKYDRYEHYLDEIEGSQ